MQFLHENDLYKFARIEYEFNWVSNCNRQNIICFMFAVNQSIVFSGIIYHLLELNWGKSSEKKNCGTECQGQ